MDRNGARPLDPTSSSRPWSREGSDVSDQFDVTLEDGDLLREVELTMNLMVAASDSDDRLPIEEIDRILGVEKRPPAAS